MSPTKSLLLLVLLLAGCKDDQRRREREELVRNIAILQKIVDDMKPHFNTFSPRDREFYGQMEIELSATRNRLAELDRGE